MSISKEEIGTALRDTLAVQQGLAEIETIDTDKAPVKKEKEVVIDENLETTEFETETEETVEPDEIETEETEETEETAETESQDEISDLNQLATAIEVEPDYLYNIKIPMADGMEPMSLSELKDGYTEFTRTAEAGQQTLETERAAFEEQKKQAALTIQTQQQVPQEIMELQVKALTISQQFQSYDWATLEKENPGEAALQKQNMATAYTQATQAYQEKVGEYQQGMQKQRQEQNIQQREIMLHNIPTWKDDSVRVADQTQMRVMLKDYGYSDGDIDNLADARAMKMARDLWQLKARNKKAVETVKKIARLPKSLKPGARANKADISKAKERGKVIEQAKGAKTDQEKASAIAKLLPK